jgi:hypothetical protein
MISLLAILFSYDLLVSIKNPLKPVDTRIKQYTIFGALVLIGYEVYDYFNVDGLDVLYF